MINQRKIVFNHVPKCGGTSIDSAFERKIKKSIRINGENANRAGTILKTEKSFLIRNVLQTAAMIEGYDFVSGHLPFNQEIYAYFKKTYIFVTMLRNPVDRFVSQYFFNFYRRNTYPYNSDTPFSDFLKTENAQRMGSNMIRMLSGKESSEEALEITKDNLFSKFKIVGVLEDLTDFSAKVKKETDIDLEIKHLNKNHATYKEVKKFITPEMKNKIIELSHLDIQLYNFVKDNLLGPPKQD